jgi:hypothetical protein
MRLERRRVVRGAVQRSAFIEFRDCLRTCIVMSLSGFGAKLSLLRSSEELPDRFSLSIGGVSAPVRIIWRTRLHVGVQFVRPALPA